MLIYAMLFSVTSISLLIYFKRLRSINLEYKRMKDTFEDIVYSFDKDLQKIREEIQRVSERAGASVGKDEVGALISDLKVRLEDLVAFKEKASAEIEKLREEINRLATKLSELDVKVGSSRTSGGVKSAVHESRPAELAPHRLVERSRALTSLTATELKVLEILAREGEKTASEIRERIGLTREHTARLMKSLYERGYVERRDDRIPFVYRLAKEMEEILKEGS